MQTTKTLLGGDSDRPARRLRPGLAAADLTGDGEWHDLHRRQAGGQRHELQQTHRVPHDYGRKAQTPHTGSVSSMFSVRGRRSPIGPNDDFNPKRRCRS